MTQDASGKAVRDFAFPHFVDLGWRLRSYATSNLRPMHSRYHPRTTVPKDDATYEESPGTRLGMFTNASF